MERKRKRERVTVDIPITLTTVLDSLEARMIDLTEAGAQISGATFPVGTKFQIEYLGQTLYAQCMWSEIDRMGVRFPFTLADGPLHDIMQMSALDDGEGGNPTISFMPPPGLPDRIPALPRLPATRFGRRN
jgi:hypothetical protein